jgi:hypothetical protein
MQPMPTPSPSFLRLLPGPLRHLVVLGAVVVSGCGSEVVPEPPRTTAPTDTATPVTRYTREFVFVGERTGVPVVVPFVFSARERDSQLEREVRAWLAHGSDWDPFLQESWSTPPAGGVWKVLPHGDLRVVAGGPSDVEALVFRRGERRLRLTPEILRATWATRDELQYRLFEGRLELAGQALRGSVLETYRVQRGPADELAAPGALDWMFVTDGGTLHLLLTEAMGEEREGEKTFAWSVSAVAEQNWPSAQVRWLEMLTVEQARREVPIAWSFRIPDGGVEGEVFSLGYHLQLGPDRPGRRAVLLRHNVEGWAQVGEDRYRIFGLLRHSQD